MQTEVILKSVISNYTAKENNELSASAGDIITVIEEKNDGWIYCENSKGQRGLIPSSILADIKSRNITRSVRPKSSFVLPKKIDMLNYRNSIGKSNDENDELNSNPKQQQYGSPQVSKSVIVTNKDKDSKEIRRTQSHSALTLQEKRKLMLARGTTIHESIIQKLEEPLDPTVMKNRDGIIFIGNQNLEDLKLISLTNNRFGYMTVEQIIKFGMLYAFKNNGFVKIFLVSYKTFLLPKELIPLLQKSLDDLLPMLNQEELIVMIKSTINLLSNWVQFCKEDIKMDKTITEDIFTFITGMSKISENGRDAVINLLEFLTKELSDLEKNEKTNEIDLKSYPKPLFKISKTPPDPRSLRLEDIKPMEIARQLTLMEFELFKKIPSEELFGLGWMKESKEWAAPNITKFISRSNLMSDWIATYLVSMENLKDRRKCLKKFIQLAQSLYELQNFNTLFAIVLALNRQPIFRLKKTWEGLTKVELSQFKKLEKLCSFDNNKTAYREEIKKAEIGKKPCLPYLGVHLGDLVFFDEGNPDTKIEKEHKFINFTKRALMVDVISKLMICQSVPYLFLPVECIQQFLWWQLNSNVMTNDDDLHKASKKLEP